jgi:hypothetical protein
VVFTAKQARKRDFSHSHACRVTIAEFTLNCKDYASPMDDRGANVSGITQFRLYENQLGVSNNTAIHIGDLARKPQFFGVAAAEVVSRASTGDGAWNGDSSANPYSNEPWSLMGGSSDYGAGTISGIFHFENHNGSIDNRLSHRTILSGY